MNENTVNQLLALNREFYQTFAKNFAQTRMRLQPGVKRVLDSLPGDADILDLGCGNGELGLTLAQRGHRGQYVGLDNSPELLEIARAALADFTNFSFFQGDLATPDWDSSILGQQPAGQQHAPTSPNKPAYTMIVAFASLHHLPGRDLHIRTFQKIHTLLAQDGRFVHSNWQFVKSDRLRKRIQPWSTLNLTSEDIDPGDYLLDWRQGGYGLRYIHLFSPEELFSLAETTGFKVVETFYSDGEGGNLGLYQVLEKAGEAVS
jgi:tRNA (uracil-5-)-methyltransferase TRM9